MNFEKEFSSRLKLKKPKNRYIKKKFESFLKNRFKSIILIHKNYIKFLTENKKNFYHPTRVAYYLSILDKKINKDKIIMAIFHNFYELKVKDKIIEDLGIKKNLKIKLKKLKIEREKRWNKKYLKKFYRRLDSTSKDVKLIKCIDKLDNLFNLFKNPNKKIKKDYLWEIKKYIFPLSFKLSPELYFYIKRLYNYNIELLNENRS